MVLAIIGRTEQEYNEVLWNQLVDHAKVYSDSSMEFMLTDGTEVSVNLAE